MTSNLQYFVYREYPAVGFSKRKAITNAYKTCNKAYVCSIPNDTIRLVQNLDFCPGLNCEIMQTCLQEKSVMNAVAFCEQAYFFFYTRFILFFPAHAVQTGLRQVSWAYSMTEFFWKRTWRIPWMVCAGKLNEDFVQKLVAFWVGKVSY